MIILISGHAGVGKSTTAKMLKERIPNSEIFSFATLVKKLATHLFNWDGEKGKEGRKLLQFIGETCRKFDKDFFVKYCFNAITDSDCSIAIIDDWRYKSEYEYLVNYETVVTIRIESKEREILKGSQAEHESEKDLNDFHFDYVISPKNLEELREDVTILDGEIYFRTKKEKENFHT